MDTPQAPEAPMAETSTVRARWDVFISHASEDKATFVRPLARALTQLGAEVWYDEFTLKLGNSLSKSIDRGLAQSRYGVVVLSRAFMSKPWPQHELGGLVTREIDGHTAIIPIWHEVTREEVSNFSPTLADKLAVRTSDANAIDIALQLLAVIRPDIYENRAPSLRSWPAARRFRSCRKNSTRSEETFLHPGSVPGERHQRPVPRARTQRARPASRPLG